MKNRKLAVLLAATLLLTLFNSALAAGGSEEDTDTRYVDAVVTEVAEGHISVRARSGVEHVVAIDGSGTRFTIDGKAVSVKEVRVGYVVTVELDEKQPVKFARNISMRSEEVAKFRR